MVIYVCTFSIHILIKICQQIYKKKKSQYCLLYAINKYISIFNYVFITNYTQPTTYEKMTSTIFCMQQEITIVTIQTYVFNVSKQIFDLYILVTKENSMSTLTPMIKMTHNTIVNVIQYNIIKVHIYFFIRLIKNI